MHIKQMAIIKWLPPLLIALSFMYTNVDAVVVQTALGPVRGEIMNGSLRFLGIPYARPPLGPRRFRAPEIPEPWSEVRDATFFGDACMQSRPVQGLNMSEDCLTLNIYLPTPDLNNDPNHKRAVMVWIHGGGFLTRYPARSDLTSLSMRGDIIGITLNYRLGIFGFLTTGDEVIKGNAGLLDQVMGLRWIQDNIEKFGGDKNRVTIFGESLGGMSVSGHVTSPMSRGLFRRAISQSGVFDNWPLPHFSNPSKREKILRHVSGLGCDVTSTASMLSCLEALDAEKLIISDTFYFLETLGPVQDGTFFPRPLPDLWREYDNMEAVDYLAGLTQDEGNFFLAMTDPNYDVSELHLGITEDTWNGVLDAMFIVSTALKPAHRDVINDQYLNGDSSNVTRVRAAIDVVRDAVMLGPTITTLDSFCNASRGKAFLYYFQQKTPSAKMSQLENYHAGHGTELAYMFGWASEDDGYDSEDMSISDAMLEAWTSFAKTGKPLVPLSDQSTLFWPQYDSSNRTYLSIQFPMTSASVKSRLLPRALSFWTVLAQALSGEHEDVTCNLESPSRFNRKAVETAMFILAGVSILLLIATVILLSHYCCHMRKTRKNGD